MGDFYGRRVVKPGFCLRGLGQTNEQQRHFIWCSISELHGEVLDSIQTSLNPLFTLLSAQPGRQSRKLETRYGARNRFQEPSNQAT